MEINKGNIENLKEAFYYEQPSLKKYGTMKEFTYSSAGSGGDAMGSNQGPDQADTNPTGSFVANANQPQSEIGDVMAGTGSRDDSTGTAF